MDGLKWIGIAVGALALLAFGLTLYGAARWERQTSKLLDLLESARLPQATPRYDARELTGLPAPVRRYFRTVLKDGQAIVAAASVDHVGSFNVGETTDQ